MTQTQTKILTLNCNGLNNKIKSKRILSVLLKSQADIILLQETHFKRPLLPVFKSPRFPIQVQAPGTSKSRGVAILISSKLRATVNDQLIDLEGRFLFLNVHIEGDAFTLALLYAPNEQPTCFIDTCLASLQKFACGPIVLEGDLNCMIDVSFDYSGPRKAREAVKAQATGHMSLRCLSEKCQLHDVWRVHHPRERDYTFFRTAIAPIQD